MGSCFYCLFQRVQELCSRICVFLYVLPVSVYMQTRSGCSLNVGTPPRS
jgi:hypothetical protein